MQQDYNNFQNNQNYQGNPYYANYNYDPNNPYYQYDPNYPVYQNVQVINTAEKKPRSVKALNIISTILSAAMRSSCVARRVYRFCWRYFRSSVSALHLY